MTYDELLTSGLLELYVAGACTEDECSMVEAAIAADPRIAREVAAIGEAVERIAFHGAIKPPARVKEAIIAGTHRAGEEYNNSSTATEFQTRQNESWPTAATWLRAASIGFLIGILPALWLFIERGSLVEERDEARSELAQARSERSVMAEKASALEEDLDLVVASDYTRVLLPAVNDRDTSAATVFWSASTKRVLIDARKLPALPDGKDYQLWAIVDGSPVSLGLVSTSGLIVQPMNPIESPTLFAVTVEPAGGSAQPTLEAMTVAGKVG